MSKLAAWLKAKLGFPVVNLRDTPLVQLAEMGAAQRFVDSLDGASFGYLKIAVDSRTARETPKGIFSL